MVFSVMIAVEPVVPPMLAIVPAVSRSITMMTRCVCPVAWRVHAVAPIPVVPLHDTHSARAGAHVRCLEIETGRPYGDSSLCSGFSGL
ncbi:MAG TPA: hypothetical protein PLA83_13700, partial [Deltaproteobacteria bacterium]|nr:hypothetical protein [Deltaproteobacteria bacterium]